VIEDIAVVRRGSTLIGVSGADNAQLERLPLGRIILIDADKRQPESTKRWYRALCSIIASARNEYADADGVHHVLMMRSGKVESMDIQSDGSIVRVRPLSTATWCAAQWRDHIDFSLSYIAEHMLPGADQQRLREEVEAFVGLRL
jgi:hypothetical protein